MDENGKNDENDHSGSVPPISGPGEGYAPMEEPGNVSLGSGRPSVSSAPGKMTFILLGAAIFLFIVIRALFFNIGEDKTKVSRPKTIVTVTPANPSTMAVPPITAVPSPPPISNNAPPPPPPIQNPPQINASKPDTEMERNRIKSSMIVSGGGLAGKLGLGPKHKNVAVGSDPNSAFQQSVIENSEADRVQATNMGDLNILIAQGKVIPAVLETAINTDLPGPLRAIVSHDVYAEAGRDVLIPKGSRMIGTYNSSIRRGQGRVFIIWTRLIRPDGVDIMINSPGIDTLGRAGQAGDVDNKYFEMFSTALLTSTMDIGVAAVGQGLFGNQQQTTTVSGNGYTTTSSPTATAMQTAIANVGQVGQAIVGSTLNLMPTINIDQGTTVNVFVNRDLEFPPEITHAHSFIQ